MKVQLLTKNPVEFVDAVPRGKKKARALAPDEVASFLEALRDTRLYPLVLTATYGGFRRGELLALTWDDVDLKSGVVRVRRALDEARDGTLTVKTTKTETSERDVVLPRFVVDVLVAHRRELEEIYGPGRLPEMIFPDLTRGTYHSPDAISAAFHYAVRQRGLKPVSLHGLRHTYNSLMRHAGIDLIVRSRALGHSEVAITDNEYGHVVPAEFFEVARRLEEQRSSTTSAGS